jgi:hypothetical protein
VVRDRARRLRGRGRGQGAHRFEQRPNLRLDVIVTGIEHGPPRHGKAEEQIVRRRRRHDVRQPQRVPMRPAVARSVHQQLVCDVTRGLTRVPITHGPPHATTPAPKCLDILQPVEQVRARAYYGRRRAERGRARRGISDAGSDGKDEQPRIVLRSATRGAHLDRPPDDTRAILGDQRDNGAPVLDRERALTDVIRAAFAAQHEKPVQPVPGTHRPGVAARGVGHLLRVRHLLGLRRRLPAQARRVVLRVIHLLARPPRTPVSVPLSLSVSDFARGTLCITSAPLRRKRCARMKRTTGSCTRCRR